MLISVKVALLPPENLQSLLSIKIHNSSASHPFSYAKRATRKPSRRRLRLLRLSVHLILLFHPARSRLHLISPNASLALHCARYPPLPYLPRPFISRESRTFPSALPPFIYPLAALALRNPKRFSFSDYLSLSPVLPCFAVRVFRADRTCALCYITITVSPYLSDSIVT